MSRLSDRFFLILCYCFCGCYCCCCCFCCCCCCLRRTSTSSFSQRYSILFHWNPAACQPIFFSTYNEWTKREWWCWRNRSKCKTTHIDDDEEKEEAAWIWRKWLKSYSFSVQTSSNMMRMTSKWTLFKTIYFSKQWVTRRLQIRLPTKVFISLVCLYLYK